MLTLEDQELDLIFSLYFVSSQLLVLSPIEPGFLLFLALYIPVTQFQSQSQGQNWRYCFTYAPVFSSFWLWDILQSEILGYQECYENHLIQQIYPGNQVFELHTNTFSGIVCHKILWVTISGKSSQERASLLLNLAYFKRAFSASIQIFLAALVKPSRD